MAHISIEIKARVKNQQKIRDILKSQKANYKGCDHQIDTYFKVRSGRLKLREGEIENFLIHYQRENKQGLKQSDVILYESKPKSTLKEVLIEALGVLIVVDKKREIYFIDNVKFHIDTVKSLGTFVEIEALGKNDKITKDELYQQCQYYLKLFGILDKELISVSYSDMMMDEHK